MTILKNETCFYIYDTKIKENLVTYNSLKERFGLHLEDREGFIKDISSQLNSFLEENHYDYLFYPQSSSDFIELVAKNCNIYSECIKKNTINNILEEMDKFKLQKMERASHLERISNMGKTFKINHLKANQRLWYEDILFERTNTREGKGILLDDSLFSGTTLRALSKATNIKDKIVIFSK